MMIFQYIAGLRASAIHCCYVILSRSLILRESLSVTFLHIAKKFCFPFRIKHFCAYIWKPKTDGWRHAAGYTGSRKLGCGQRPR